MQRHLNKEIVHPGNTAADDHVGSVTDEAEEWRFGQHLRSGALLVQKIEEEKEEEEGGGKFLG